jgi:hypothetical protein
MLDASEQERRIDKNYTMYVRTAVHGCECFMRTGSELAALNGCRDVSERQTSGRTGDVKNR